MQSWKDTNVLKQHRPFQQSWKEFAKQHDWQYFLWTNADNEALVRDHFPFLLMLYQGLKLDINRADFVRSLYLHKFGGKIMLFSEMSGSTSQCTSPLLTLVHWQTWVVRGSLVELSFLDFMLHCH